MPKTRSEDKDLVEGLANVRLRSGLPARAGGRHDQYVAVPVAAVEDTLAVKIYAVVAGDLGHDPRAHPLAAVPRLNHHHDRATQPFAGEPREVGEIQPLNER